jgi:hypothetical protein
MIMCQLLLVFSGADSYHSLDSLLFGTSTGR